MAEEHAVQLWHVLATGGGGILATIGLVWRTWIKPIHEARVDLERWKAQVEARLSSGEKTFGRHAKDDQAILAKLTAIEERLRGVENKLARLEERAH